MKTEKIIIAGYIPEAYHNGCGAYGADLIEDFDGSQWTVCSRCGEELGEVLP